MCVAPLDPGGGTSYDLRVRLTADPVSVPGARRFVGDGLHAWGLESLVDDAALCVSELAGNAALHSAGDFMTVAVRRGEGLVRISVEDNGATPADAVEPRTTFPTDGHQVEELDTESTTGRGLAIVSMLAKDWGVENTAHGKRIWAELSEEGGMYDVRSPSRDTSAEALPEAIHDGLPTDPTTGLPADWVAVRLEDCPVELSLRQDEHLDELIRELQLLHGDTGNPRSQELAAQMKGILGPPAHARHMGRQLAQQAAAAGLDHIDIEMPMPRAMAIEVENLHEAVKAADRLCEEMRLLTLASSPDLRLLREWMTDQLSSQARHDAAPVPWRAWLKERGLSLTAPAST